VACNQSFVACAVSWSAFLLKDKKHWARRYSLGQVLELNW